MAASSSSRHERRRPDAGFGAFQEQRAPVGVVFEQAHRAVAVPCPQGGGLDAQVLRGGHAELEHGRLAVGAGHRHHPVVAQREGVTGFEAPAIEHVGQHGRAGRRARRGPASPQAPVTLRVSAGGIHTSARVISVRGGPLGVIVPGRGGRRAAGRAARWAAVPGRARVRVLCRADRRPAHRRHRRRIRRGRRVHRRAAGRPGGTRVRGAPAGASVLRPGHRSRPDAARRLRGDLRRRRRPRPATTPRRGPPARRAGQPRLAQRPGDVRPLRHRRPGVRPGDVPHRGRPLRQLRWPGSGVDRSWPHAARADRGAARAPPARVGRRADRPRVRRAPRARGRARSRARSTRRTSPRTRSCAGWAPPAWVVWSSWSGAVSRSGRTRRRRPRSVRCRSRSATG